MEDIIITNEALLVNDTTTNANYVSVAQISGRVETKHIVQHAVDFSTFNGSDFPPLPNLGEEVLEGIMYTDGGYNWKCIQTHNRTEHNLVDIPALFVQYRANGAAWLQPINEFSAYYSGNLVTHNSKYWVSITEVANVWEPGVAGSENLWEETDENGEPLPAQPITVWVQPTGAHDAYNIGDKVYYPTELDPVYESLIDANTYSPDAYPAGWQIQP